MMISVMESQKCIFWSNIGELEMYRLYRLEISSLWQIPVFTFEVSLLPDGPSQEPKCRVEEVVPVVCDCMWPYAQIRPACLFSLQFCMQEDVRNQADKIGHQPD